MKYDFVGNLGREHIGKNIPTTDGMNVIHPKIKRSH